MSDFPDMVVALDEAEPSGGGAIFHWTLTGVNTGPGGTGKRVHISGYEEWTFGVDGLDAESRGHFDAAEYARQFASGADS